MLDVGLEPEPEEPEPDELDDGPDPDPDDEPPLEGPRLDPGGDAPDIFPTLAGLDDPPGDPDGGLGSTAAPLRSGCEFPTIRRVGSVTSPVGECIGSMVVRRPTVPYSWRIMLLTEPNPPMSCASFSASLARRPAISRAQRLDTSSISLLLAMAFASAFSLLSVSATRSACRSRWSRSRSWYASRRSFTSSRRIASSS